MTPLEEAPPFPDLPTVPGRAAALREHRGALVSAAAGALVGVMALLLGFAGLAPVGSIQALFLLAPLVAVPLGLRLAAMRLSAAPAAPAGTVGSCHESAISTVARAIQPVAGALLVVAFLLPEGIPAAALACGWGLLTICAGLDGARRAAELLLGRRPWRLEEAGDAAALLYLPVGGAWLLLSRGGLSPMGYVEPIVLLTAVHFHYAGFAAPILAGRIGQAARTASPLAGWLAPVVLGGVIAGPGLLAAGWALDLPPLKLAAAGLLAVSHSALACLAVAGLRSLRGAAARALLAISAASLVTGMVLAGVYAVGEFTGVFTFDIPRMARLHGVANAIGFTLCGLLAFTLVSLQERGGQALLSAGSGSNG